MIISYDDFGTLKVMSKSGKVCEYEKVSPFYKNQIEKFFLHKQPGRAWQILCQHKVISVTKNGVII